MVTELPEWNYNGSSCKQASTEDSEIIVRPYAFFSNPFRDGDNILVLFTTFRWANEKKTELRPANTNFRHFATPIFEKDANQHTWFGIEQE